MDLNDPSIATRIAHVSSRRDGDGEQRWTEISVYWLHAPGVRKRWVALVEGRSSIPGEDQKVYRTQKGRLEPALAGIMDSRLGQVAKDQARDWLTRNSAAVFGKIVTDTMDVSDAALAGGGLIGEARDLLAFMAGRWRHEARRMGEEGDGHARACLSHAERCEAMVARIDEEEAVDA